MLALAIHIPLSRKGAKLLIIRYLSIQPVNWPAEKSARLAQFLPVHSAAMSRNHAAVYLLLIRCAMHSGSAPAAPLNSATDIVFACAHCATSFVVDGAAAGATLSCQHCGKPTLVPNVALQSAATSAIRVSDLQHQLKENESQRTEITGYINQISIQLHRWQLRLKSLNERQAKLQAELASLCGK